MALICFSLVGGSVCVVVATVGLVVRTRLVLGATAPSPCAGPVTVNAAVRTTPSCLKSR